MSLSTCGPKLSAKLAEARISDKWPVSAHPNVHERDHARCPQSARPKIETAQSGLPRFHDRGPEHEVHSSRMMESRSEQRYLYSSVPLWQGVRTAAMACWPLKTTRIRALSEGIEEVPT